MCTYMYVYSRNSVQISGMKSCTRDSRELPLIFFSPAFVALKDLSVSSSGPRCWLSSPAFSSLLFAWVFPSLFVRNRQRFGLGFAGLDCPNRLPTKPKPVWGFPNQNQIGFLTGLAKLISLNQVTCLGLTGSSKLKPVKEAQA